MLFLEEHNQNHNYIQWNEHYSTVLHNVEILQVCPLLSHNFILPVTLAKLEIWAQAQETDAKILCEDHTVSLKETFDIHK